MCNKLFLQKKKKTKKKFLPQNITLRAVSIIVHITYTYMICFILKNIINIPFFIDLDPSLYYYYLFQIKIYFYLDVLFESLYAIT